MDPTLVHALCYNTTLTSINLFEHEEGICPKELSTVLRCNTTLTSCRVEWPLDLYSLGLIAAGLKHNASLTHLDNGVGAKRWQKGEMKIESYLQRNKDNQIKRSWTLYEILLVRLRR
jgi:hypothetical protein